MENITGICSSCFRENCFLTILADVPYCSICAELKVEAEGSQDREDGIESHQNPYTDDDDLAYSWLVGWYGGTVGYHNAVEDYYNGEAFITKDNIDEYEQKFFELHIR